MNIYLSPSTQERNVGSGAYGTEEYRMNQLADLVFPLLQHNGFTVFRNKPTMNLSQVVQDSNEKIGHQGLHVALHSNAGGGAGTEIWFYTDSVVGKKLAEDIYREVAPITPHVDRGVKHTTSFSELSKTKSVAVLLEVIFHDRPDEANWMINHMKEVAVAIVKGICKHVGRPFTEQVIVDTFIHTVVLGDNLTKIANKYHTTIETIMSLNPSIKNRNLIYYGMQLKIPRN